MRALAIVALAACAGTSTKPPPANTATATAAPASATGTSGMPGFDWGASEDAVRAAASGVTSWRDGGLWVVGHTDGMGSLTSFQFGAHGLEQIGVEWTEGFASMDECGTHWKTLRAKYDGRFGASQSDNLAAYWRTATANIQLACNPNENGAGVLSMVYAPLDK